MRGGAVTVHGGGGPVQCAPATRGERSDCRPKVKWRSTSGRAILLLADSRWCVANYSPADRLPAGTTTSRGHDFSPADRLSAGTRTSRARVRLSFGAGAATRGARSDCRPKVEWRSTSGRAFLLLAASRWCVANFSPADRFSAGATTSSGQEFSPADRLSAGATTSRGQDFWAAQRLLAGATTSCRLNFSPAQRLLARTQRAAGGALGTLARTRETPAVTGNSAVRGPTVG